MKRALAYCTTGSYMQLTATSVASVCKNYNLKSQKLDILVITENSNMEDINKIREIPRIYDKNNISVTVWGKPEIIKQKVHYDNQRFPEVTLWRLFLPSYFSNYDQIMYLDNDTLAYNDINIIFDSVYSTVPVAAVRDFYFYTIKSSKDISQSFNVKTMQDYINSGLLIFNVNEYNKQLNIDILLKMINEKKYNYLDQTIINIIFENTMQRLPLNFHYQKDDNWLYNWAKFENPAVAKEIEQAKQNIIIRHFVEFGQNSMPWEHLNVRDQWEKDFWNYLLAVKQN